MSLDGTLFDEQLCGNLSVGQSSCNESEDLQFATSEITKAFGYPSCWSQGFREYAHKTPHYGWIEKCVSSDHSADGSHKLCRRAVFEQESTGSRLECLEDIFVFIKRREHEHPAPTSRQDASGRVKPVKNWHLNVHQNHVRGEAGDLVDRLCAVRCLSNNQQVEFAVEDYFQACAYQRLIISYHDRDRVIAVCRHLPSVGVAK